MATKLFVGNLSFQATDARDRILLEPLDHGDEYVAEPSVPVEAWRQVTFDDSTWLSGPTGIGYGDGDEATPSSSQFAKFVEAHTR